MNQALKLVKPAITPPLDEEFRPAVLANRAYINEIARSGEGVSMLLGLERSDGYISNFTTQVFPEDHPPQEAALTSGRPTPPTPARGAPRGRGPLHHIMQMAGAERFSGERL